jgi:hypothetical protein
MEEDVLEVGKLGIKGNFEGEIENWNFKRIKGKMHEFYDVDYLVAGVIDI